MLVMPSLGLTRRAHMDFPSSLRFFFFNDTATTEIYTLSLHDALPISPAGRSPWPPGCCAGRAPPPCTPSSSPSAERPQRLPSGAWRCSWPRSPSTSPMRSTRSEEHTSELQSRPHLVCRLLLEKKNKKR